MARHMGNLTVTPENVHEFPAVTEIYGHLCITDGAELMAADLQMIRGWLTIDTGAVLHAPKLGEINGWLTISTGRLHAANLARVWSDVTLGPNADVGVAARLARVGALVILKGGVLYAPMLQHIDNSLTVMNDGILDVPTLTRVGKSITLREGALLTAPELAHIGGYYDADPTARLIAPKFLAQ